MAYTFSDVITSKEELREIVGHPGRGAVEKVMDRLDEMSRGFIARSPFVVIASCDAAGRMDISPKGDPPGFVRVLDDHTLIIPDRPGNRRADTFINILERPAVALFFMVPGKNETLRVNGRARIVRDDNLRELCAVQGKLPALLLAVTVEEVFFHCTKCIVRSHLWQADDWLQVDDLPSLGEVVVKQLRLDTPVERVQAALDEDVQQNLY